MEDSMPRSRVLIALLISASACRDTPAPTEASFDPATSNASAGTPIIASTNGGGRYLLQGVLDVQFAFTALQRSDGRASGNFHQRVDNEGALIDFRAAVTCVTTDPVTHRAWIGGVVTENRSTDPAFRQVIHEPGHDIWFRVVDYGEGEASPPDRTTFMGFEGAAGFFTSEAYCLGRPWPEGDARTWPVTSGNIQVR
jgi:hypothetical protein